MQQWKYHLTMKPKAKPPKKKKKTSVIVKAGFIDIQLIRSTCLYYIKLNRLKQESDNPRHTQVAERDKRNPIQCN